MMHRRFFIAALGAVSVAPHWAGADTGVLTASAAHDAMKAGQLLLIDIRTPQEWQQTGVADGAWPLDMQAKDFGTKIMQVVRRNPKHQIAVICRSGNRSGYMRGLLQKNGIHNVADVSEGMGGGRNGRGWINSGLPMVTAEQALDRLPRDLQAR